MDMTTVFPPVIVTCSETKYRKKCHQFMTFWLKLWLQFFFFKWNICMDQSLIRWIQKNAFNVTLSLKCCTCEWMRARWSFVVTDISILTFCKLWLFICFDKHDQKLNCAKINCGLMEDTRSPEYKHNLPHLFLLVWNTHHHRHIAKEITKGTHTHNEQQTMIWVFLVFFLWTSWF